MGGTVLPEMLLQQPGFLKLYLKRKGKKKPGFLRVS
jgi:hypothetical protein